MIGGAEHERALDLEGIDKRFAGVTALDHADLHVDAGTVHALLGENGAGKTTLMRVAYGMLRADAGTVTIGGVERRLRSPADAIAAGLGMVHQHYALVLAMTVADNVALGLSGHYNARKAAERVWTLSAASGLALDPRAIVGDLSVEVQQRVEIVKALARDAQILILDEPTAVLAPAAATDLLAWLRRFADGGHAVVLITHKLREALAVADAVTVLRRGRTVLSIAASATSEAELAAAMLGSPLPDAGDRSGDRTGGDLASSKTRGVATAASTSAASTETGGDQASSKTREVATAASTSAASTKTGGDQASSKTREVATAASPSAASTKTGGDQAGSKTTGVATAASRSAASTKEEAPPVIVAEQVTLVDDQGVIKIEGASLVVRAGEIVGIAAVEGEGQHELLRALAGRHPVAAGRLHTPADVGFVPEDRQRDALVLGFPLYENVALRGAGSRRGTMAWGSVRAETRRLLDEFDVRAAGEGAAASSLSGGNQQKLVVARELEDDPRALVVENPTRGLDIQAMAAVHERLRAARDRGMAVVIYASDIDEVLSLADRVVVIAQRQLREVPLDREVVGRAMVGAGAARPRK